MTSFEKSQIKYFDADDIWTSTDSELTSYFPILEEATFRQLNSSGGTITFMSTNIGNHFAFQNIAQKMHFGIGQLFLNFRITFYRKSSNYNGCLLGHWTLLEF